MSISHLSISKKIAVAGVVLVLPVTILGYFFIQEKNTLIQFTQQEIRGVNYLRVAHGALAAATSPTASKDELARAADALSKAEQTEGGLLGVTQAAQSAIASLQAAANGKDESAAVESMQALISAISDNSNITLDPDADSYFVGDIAVNQSANLLRQISNVVSIAKELQSERSEENKIALAKAHDGVADSYAALSTDVSKAIKGNADGSLKASLEADSRQIGTAVDKFMAAAKTNDNAALQSAAAELSNKVREFTSKSNDEMERLLKARIAGFESSLIERLGVCLALLFVGAALSFYIVRSITRSITESKDITDRMAKGDYALEVTGRDGQDEIGAMARSLEELRRSLDTNTRLKQALDCVTSNVMMADENFNIIYANDAVKSFLREAEKDIQKDLPRFSVDGMMGANIDIFHKNPAHQRNMLAGLNAATKTSIQVGGRSFNLVAVPLFDQNKKRIGTTVEWQDGTAAGMVEAINKSSAVIEFMPDGTIIQANNNFLQAMGYTLEEIKGKHHSMFCDKSYVASPAYQQFWSDLNHNKAQAGEFLRHGKGGKEIWINATYNPIADLKGKVVRVVKTASDITEAKLESMMAARLKLALDTCTSNVMMADANYNIIYVNSALKDFLTGSEKEIQKDLPRFSVAGLIGQNIDIFHKNPAHQRNMLEGLKMPTKTSIQVGGKSYNLVAAPIFGKNGERLGTVVEWADGAALGLVDAINKSAAVIEFMPDGTIVNANDNFLRAMGYALDEIKGKHHRMFCEKDYVESPAYRQFWDALARGETQTDEFKRLGKGGKEIWIQASYNPIADLKGKVVRVVKTATDVTEMVTTRTENERGMNEAVKVLTGISQGDLTQKMELEYKGSYSEIKTAINATVERLYDMVKQIIDAAQSVNSAAGEIASGSTDLSQRTEEQASSLEETAASMEEITGTVKQNSSNASTANELSTSANQVASDGGRVVEEAVSAMGNIEKSSKKISDIISVIDEIAFQTNLLALNAAVEAARAGDAGKGFAVVASEVRSLAGRSASASKEIKALINESAAQVQSGAQLVNQAGETLRKIVSSVQQVAGIVSEIASASQEQATGIDEINTAVTQMDEVTQQNAALVEENTAAAQSMVEQARGLEKLMSFFKLSDQEEEGTSGEDERTNVVALGVKRSPEKPAEKRAAAPASKANAKDKKPKTSMASPKKTAVGGSAGYDDDWKEF